MASTMNFRACSFFRDYTKEGDGEESGLLAAWLWDEASKNQEEVHSFFEISEKHERMIAETKDILEVLQAFTDAHQAFKAEV